MGVTYINPYRFGFNPLSLSPQAWYDASDTSTITSSGGAVSQWNDKSGNGRNVTQASSASQPGTGAVTKNGLNVLTFDGGDWMQASTASHWKFLHDGTDYLVAAAVQWGTTANPNALYVLASTFNSGPDQIGAWFGFDDRSPRNDRLRQNIANGSGATAPFFSVINESADSAASVNAFNVFTILANPDALTASNRSSLFNNAGTAIANNSNTTAVSSSNPSSAFLIGALANIGVGPTLGFLTGRVAEIVIVSGANATEANRVALRDYLNAKWAVY